MSEDTPEIVPGLRPDIEIVRTASDGSPAWVIHDPLQHRYFKINDETRKLLKIWKDGSSIEELLDKLADIEKIDLEEKQVQALILFLRQNSLLVADEKENWRQYSQRAQSEKQGLLTKILRNYVFFKVPLFKSQPLLTFLLPFVSIFFSRVFLITAAICGVVGLYLVSHQWPVFANDIQKFFTLEGVAIFGLALIIVKAFHELGHAFTATRYGVKVPTMGVAFFLLTPLLYTDVSDAWRLRSRRQRFMISAAGIITELIVASIATLIWAFLPDGNGRDVALVLASTGWILSLTINLNPLIKFDGYYLLCDMMGVDNLQQRSFALGKWKLRELLFAPNIPVPEKFSPPMQKWLIILAWFTWVYRLILFTTIALVVYYFTFKLLGILLLVLELWLLVARPIIAEIKQWHEIGIGSFSISRMGLTMGAIIGCLAMIVIPWSGSVTVPAILQAEQLSMVYPGSAAKVKSLNVRRAMSVRKNDILAVLENPQLKDEIAATRINIASINSRIGNALIEQIDAEQLLILRQSLQVENAKLAGLQKRIDDLIIRAPFDGIVRELNPYVQAGRWINAADFIAAITAPKSQILRGYVAQADISRLGKSARGRFIPDDLARHSIDVKLKNIARSGSQEIEIAALAAPNGGEIRVEINHQNQFVPIQAQYLVELTPTHITPNLSQMVRGVVELQGTRRSFLMAGWNQVAKVINRETGF